MKDSTKKNAAIGAGAAAAGGTAAALLLRRKKPLRIGTAVSPSQVVKHVPKTREAVGRVLQCSERLDAVLKNFEAISTEELPWSGGLCSSDKPCFPSLFLSRSTNPGLLDMPGEGSAMVQYKIKRREVDESREDGQPLYGASIEIRSIDPMPEMEPDEDEEDEDIEEDDGGEYEEDDSELSSTLFLKEFACGGGKPAKKAKAKKSLFGKTALASRELLRELSVARDRDGEGRFASGNIPGADDFAIASQAAKKKPGMGLGGKVAIGAGVAGLGAAAGALALRKKPLLLR